MFSAGINDLEWYACQRFQNWLKTAPCVSTGWTCTEATSDDFWFGITRCGLRFSSSLNDCEADVRCTMYDVRRTLYDVRCTMYDSTLYAVRCTMYAVRCTMYDVRRTLYDVRCTLYNVRTMYADVPKYLNKITSFLDMKSAVESNDVDRWRWRWRTDHETFKPDRTVGRRVVSSAKSGAVQPNDLSSCRHAERLPMFTNVKRWRHNDKHPASSLDDAFLMLTY